MSEKKTQPKNNTIIPNDGSYLGAKKAQAIKAKKIQQEFIESWNSQKTLLKDSEEYKELRRRLKKGIRKSKNNM